MFGAPLTLKEVEEAFSALQNALRLHTSFATCLNPNLLLVYYVKSPWLRLIEARWTPNVRKSAM